MGKYINQTSNGQSLGASYGEKINALVADGGLVVGKPTEWREGLVCVVNNGPFAAAAYCYDAQELQVFVNDSSGRPITWIQLSHAKNLAQ